MPAVGEIFQMTLIQQCKFQILETVIHFRARTALSPTDAQLVTVTDNWINSVAKVQSNRVTYPSVRWKEMTPLAFDQRILAPTIAAGNFNVEPVNNQIALIFTKRTGVAGMRHRGRMYIGGIPVDAGNNGLADGSLATAAGTVAGELLAKFGEEGTDPTMCAGVYSREIGGSLPFTVGGWQAITKWDPQLIFGVQRKRRLGVGI
jgi:hypothetical protein